MKRSLLALILGSLAIGLTVPARAVEVGEVDTFSASLEGWFAGGGPFGQVPPGSPVLVSTGGPAGAGDSFMQLVANGSAGPGGRLVGMNASQWAGNYAAAGVSLLAMDLRNFGTTDLTVRLYLEDPIPGPPQNEAVTAGVLLPAGGTWVHATFSLAPQDLTVLQGDVATLLGNTTVLRIFDGEAADFPPERVIGTLGIDNVRAIPEPATVALMALGLSVIGWQVRRRRG